MQKSPHLYKKHNQCHAWGRPPGHLPLQQRAAVRRMIEHQKRLKIIMLSTALRITLCALLALLLAMTAAHAGDKTATPATISGTLAYRERIALPPGAEVIVQLLDASRADAPATVVAERRRSVERQVPIPFSLDFDRAAIDARRHYVLSARIVIGERQLFASDRPVPVLTQGRETVAKLLLKMTK